MSNNAVPHLTTEERRRYLKCAEEARRSRAQLRQYMKAGNITLAEALDDTRAKRLPVRQLLASVPGIGTAKAERIMLALHIAPNRRVGGLGSRQRAALLALEQSGWDPSLYCG